MKRRQGSSCSGWQGAGAADAHDAGFVHGLATGQGQLMLMMLALCAGWPKDATGQGQLMLMMLALCGLDTGQGQVMLMMLGSCTGLPRGRGS